MRPKKLSDQQIEGVCRDLHARSRHVLFEDVTQELRSRFAAQGRAARVASILKRVRNELEVLTAPDFSATKTATPFDQTDLLKRLAAAEQRATESEAREHSNQRFFARRYAEQLDQLEAEKAHWYATRGAGVSSAQYLRLYQRAASIRQRLARYESVEPLVGESDSPQT
jgi:hypothetical protein